MGREERRRGGSKRMGRREFEGAKITKILI